MSIEDGKFNKSPGQPDTTGVHKTLKSEEVDSLIYEIKNLKKLILEKEENGEDSNELRREMKEKIILIKKIRPELVTEE
jgi:hypothetical protein